MNKFISIIKKYSFIIVIAMLLVIMTGLIVGVACDSKKGLSFIPFGAEGYCHDVHSLTANTLTEYKNISKIAEFTSDEPIIKVNIEFFDMEHDLYTTFIEDGANSNAFAIDWRNNADAHKIEMYMSCNIDGQSADAFRKSLLSIDYEFRQGVLKINLRKINSINIHTFNSDRLLAGLSEIEFLSKFKMQFYTIISD